MLHLLREDSISQVATNEAELLEIPERNMATLRSLGLNELTKRLKAAAVSLPELER
jgi:hypothetical protein